MHTYEREGGLMNRTFDPGASVVWRSRPGGRIGYTLSAWVVADTPVYTVLYQPAGSICMQRTGVRGGPNGRNLIEATWDGGYEAVVWAGPSTLHLHRYGAGYTIIRRWDADLNRAVGWYLNLDAPWQRTSIGFDSEDLVLDVRVRDDGAGWAWKDEDELAWCVAQGYVSPAQATVIRTAGERAIADLEAGAWPFSADWSVWQPDSAWPIPQLPEGWQSED